jgi:DnaK suppressor protein
VAADTKKGAVVKANASKAPAQAGSGKTPAATSKKSVAAKPASVPGAAVKAATAKKVVVKAAPKAAPKPVPASSPKAAKPPAAGKTAAPGAAKTSGKPTASQPVKAKDKPRAHKAAGAKAAASPKAAAAKASTAAPAKATKTVAPAGKTPSGASRPGIGVGTKAPPPKRVTEGYGKDERFLASQRAALERERVTYLEQAASLKAEAESLVEEMEPGDIQFDDESGEGGTVTVDRERDLALSAQALAAVEEIDHALAKMNNGTYGICENCGRLIPKARLEALPYARLCIDCKSGGLSRR